MKLTITQECIDAGSRSDAYYCPIALSAKEQLGNVSVYAGIQGLEVYTENEHGELDYGHKTVYWYPPNVKNFVRDFDAGKTVNPFEWELE